MFVPPTFRRHLCSARLTWTCSTPFDEALPQPSDRVADSGDRVIASIRHLKSPIGIERLAPDGDGQRKPYRPDTHLDHHIPAYAKRLYPPGSGNLTLHYLCGLWHRLHVAAKLSVFICEWATKEIFLRTTEAQKREFAGQRGGGCGVA